MHGTGCRAGSALRGRRGRPEADEGGISNKNIDSLLDLHRHVRRQQPVLGHHPVPRVPTSEGRVSPTPPCQSPSRAIVTIQGGRDIAHHQSPCHTHRPASHLGTRHITHHLVTHITLSDTILLVTGFRVGCRVPRFKSRWELRHDPVPTDAMSQGKGFQRQRSEDATCVLPWEITLPGRQEGQSAHHTPPCHPGKHHTTHHPVTTGGNAFIFQNVAHQKLQHRWDVLVTVKTCVAILVGRFYRKNAYLRGT